MHDNIPAGADAYWQPADTDPHAAEIEALEALDLPDHILDVLAATAAWEARCEAHALEMALALAGGDAWVCERLPLAGGAL